MADIHNYYGIISSQRQKSFMHVTDGLSVCKPMGDQLYLPSFEFGLPRHAAITNWCLPHVDL